MPHALSIAQTADTANVVEWAKLSLSSPRARVLRLARILFDDNDHPIAFEEEYCRWSAFQVCPQMAAVTFPTLCELAQRHGISLGRATERISIVPATKDIASHLRITAGTNVLKLDRIAETADGEPVEWRVAHIRGANIGPS